MKDSLRQGFFVAVFLLLSGVAQAADTYTLDSNHTNIDWRLNHFGFSNPSGKLTKAQGTLVLDEAHPANSKVRVTLSPADLITGIDALDEHLKSKDFFDVVAFPTATFESTLVTLTGKDSADVQGNLTIHGVTKPITLHVHLNKIGINMMKKKTAGSSATTVIKRSDFGITRYLPDLGDEVRLTIESEANLKT